MLASVWSQSHSETRCQLITNSTISRRPFALQPRQYAPSTAKTARPLTSWEKPLWKDSSLRIPADPLLPVGVEPQLNRLPLTSSQATDQDQSALLDNLRELCLVLSSETIQCTSPKTTSPGPGPSRYMTRDSGIWRMLTTSPKGDRLHWSAISYHIGAATFIVNTLLAWVPYAYPHTELPGQIKYGVGLTTFPANIFFWFGAYLELADTINKLQPACKLTKDEIDYGSTHDASSASSAKKAAQIDVESCLRTREQSVHDSNLYRRHTWFPSFHQWSNRSTDTTVSACIIQLVGATVYIMIGVADLPGVSSSLTPSQKVLLNTLMPMCRC